MRKHIQPRERLRAGRRARRWSLRDLEAELAERGLVASNSFLSQIEQGTRGLGRLDLAVELEVLFGIPVESWPAFAAMQRLLEIRRAAA